MSFYHVLCIALIIYSTDEIHLQIWRKHSDNVYTMVYNTPIEPVSGESPYSYNLRMTMLPEYQYFTVQPGDVIGIQVSQYQLGDVIWNTGKSVPARGCYLEYRYLNWAYFAVMKLSQVSIFNIVRK